MTSSQPRAERMPVLFAGHGSPMNAIEDNGFSQGFSLLSEGMTAPNAILVVSAHWYVAGTFLTAQAQPKTIHDFAGFPQELFEVQYPAPGSPKLAARVRSLLKENESAPSADLSTDWGLDHGTWSVLRHMFPRANIPVLQLSIDRRFTMKQHFEVGRALSDLRDEGVLIVASGNITHNLRDAMGRMRSGQSEIPPWAQRFDDSVKQALLAHDTQALLRLQPETEDGRMAHPSPDHFIPLIYALGASETTDSVSFPMEGFDLGSISMRNVRFG